MIPLWKSKEVLKATKGAINGSVLWQANGVSIDSRTIFPGNIFIAIDGEKNDGHNFVKELSEKKEIPYTEAQDLLYKEGLSSLISINSEGNAAEGAVGIAERTVYDNLVEDMRRSLRFYAKQTGQSFFLKIFLTGGGASTIGLTTFINEKLNIECDVFDPFLNMEGKDNISALNPSQFSTALGLSIRGGMDNE